MAPEALFGGVRGSGRPAREGSAGNGSKRQGAGGTRWNLPEPCEDPPLRTFRCRPGAGKGVVEQGV
eukprot:14162449-Alexandrium_andersonii.AAC.1